MEVHLYESTLGSCRIIETICRAHGLEPNWYFGAAAGPQAREAQPCGPSVYFIDVRSPQGIYIAQQLAQHAAPLDFLVCVTAADQPPPCLCLAAVSPTLPGAGARVRMALAAANRLALTAGRYLPGRVLLMDVIALRGKDEWQIELLLTDGSTRMATGQFPTFMATGGSCLFLCGRNRAANLLHVGAIEINDHKIHLKNGKTLPLYRGHYTQKAAHILQGGYSSK